MQILLLFLWMFDLRTNLEDHNYIFLSCGFIMYVFWFVYIFQKNPDAHTYLVYRVKVCTSQTWNSWKNEIFSSLLRRKGARDGDPNGGAHAYTCINARALYCKIKWTMKSLWECAKSVIAGSISLSNSCCCG